MSSFSGVDFLADLFGRDVESALEVFDDDVEWIVPGDPRYGGGAHRGRPAVVEFFARVLGLFPDGLAVERSREWRGVGGVAVEAVLAGQAANARPYRNNYVFVFDVDGAKVRRVREYCDTSYAEAVLGAQPA